MPSSDPKKRIAANNRFVVEAAKDALGSMVDMKEPSEMREAIGRIRAYLDFAHHSESGLTSETINELEQAEIEAQARLLNAISEPPS